ncbi:arabinofuranosidase catalytic domain-containing protein [Streptomyces sp. NPDC001674]|uniref:arabinofuranosidase catalytic domain-containing protein n=1 Tax=Streptomyces sp. NPDC001674 TaxID=3154394 RepID=UPI00332200F4
MLALTIPAQPFSRSAKEVRPLTTRSRLSRDRRALPTAANAVLHTTGSARRHRHRHRHRHRTGTGTAAAPAPCRPPPRGPAAPAPQRKRRASPRTARALLTSNNGPRYPLRRASDATVRDAGVSFPKSVADAAAQDSVCAGHRLRHHPPPRPDGRRAPRPPGTRRDRRRGNGGHRGHGAAQRRRPEGVRAPRRPRHHLLRPQPRLHRARALALGAGVPGTRTRSPWPVASPSEARKRCRHPR